MSDKAKRLFVESIIQADSWVAVMTIAEEHRQLLGVSHSRDLSEIFEQLSEQYRDDKELQEKITRRHRFIDEAAQSGIRQTFVNLEEFKRITAFVTAPWGTIPGVASASKMELHAQLLDYESEKILQFMIEFAEETENAFLRDYLSELQKFLRCCREYGLEKAFTDLLPSPEITEKVVDFSTAQDLPDMLNILAEYEETLFRASAEIALESFCFNAISEGETGLFKLFTARRDLLILCRTQGTTEGVANWLRSQLLIACLQLLDEPEGGPSEVVELLRANSTLIDEKFVETLDAWAKEIIRALSLPERAKLLKLLLTFGQLVTLSSITDNMDRFSISIKTLQLAEDFYSKRQHPEMWAEIQCRLGDAHRLRQRDNMEGAFQAYQGDTESAVKYYHNALKIIGKNKLPELWAGIQLLLGVAFQNRVFGNAEENFDRGISYIKESLRIYTKSTHPVDYTVAHAALGGIFRQRSKGNRLRNFQRAVEHFSESLKISIQLKDAHQVALIHHELGTTYGDLIKAESTENSDAAIYHYAESLKFFSKDAFPFMWASLHHNLGFIFVQKTAMGGVDYNGLAESHFKSALEVFSPSTYPHHCSKSAANLGAIYALQRNWQAAYEAYEIAIEASETVYNSLIARPDQEGELELITELYSGFINACAHLAEHPQYRKKGLEMAESGRARIFLEQVSLSNSSRSEGADQSWSRREEELLAELRKSEKSLLWMDSYFRAHDKKRESYMGDMTTVAFKHHADLKREYREHLEQLERNSADSQQGHESRPLNSLTWNDIREFSDRLGEKEGLVEFYVTPEAIVAFVLRKSVEAPDVVRIPLNQERLNERYLMSYRQDILLSQAAS